MSDITNVLMVVGVLLGFYFLYLLFTQPQAALRVLGAIFMGVGRLLYFIAIGLYNLFSGIIRMFSRKR